jgi:hypothetical protein
MALNKDTLGQALYDTRLEWLNRDIDSVLQEYGTLEAARLAMCKAEAEVIINHIKNNADGVYQTGTLVAGANAVTPTAPVAIKIQ